MAKPDWYPLNANQFKVRIGDRPIGFTHVSGINLMDHYAVTEKQLHAGQRDVKETVIQGFTDNPTEESKKDPKRGRVLTLKKALKPDYYDAEQSFLMDIVKEKPLVELITVVIRRPDSSGAYDLNFENCTLVAYSLSDLDAFSNRYVEQTFQFEYSKITIEEHQDKFAREWNRLSNIGF